MMQPKLPPPALRLRIDREALAANWQVLDQLSSTARAGAAVKADAYGLGARLATQVLQEAGCRDFFVAHWQEVPAISDVVDPGAVSVLHGPLTPADVAFARSTSVRPVINSLKQAQLWIDAGGGPCDLMVDTGINRLGLPMSELGAEIIHRLEVDVLHSHLASADEESALNELQRRRWNEARQTLRHNRASLANSAGILLGSGYHGDLTRPGIALYGGIPRGELAGRIRQVAVPEAALLQTRQLSAGDSVGYNETFVADRPMRVGVASIGYADGYLQCWSNKGRMLAGGRDLPLLGKVSMDMTVIDLTEAPDLREGDWVALDYDLPQAAAVSGLSQYELLTVLGRRFAR